MSLNIIWLHGWGSNSKVWRELSAGLPLFKHHYPSFKSVNVPTDLMVPIVESLSEKKTILVGWSLGGMLAIETALQFPEHIIGIIGINTTKCFVHKNSELGWPKRIISKMKKKFVESPNETLLDFIQSMFSQDDINFGLSTKYHQQVLEDKTKITSDFTANGLMAGLDYFKTTDLSGRILNLKRPMMWIHGENDDICPVKGFLKLRQSLTKDPNHYFKLLPKTGHVSFFRYPGETIKLVKDFIHAACH